MEAMISVKGAIEPWQPQPLAGQEARKDSFGPQGREIHYLTLRPRVMDRDPNIKYHRETKTITLNATEQDGV